FSRPALETLAIIAYRQPVTRAEIEYLRGVDSGSVLKTLLEKHLVRILGKKDVAGKPLIYGTSQDFLELFGLADLSSLPTLSEFSELAPDEDAIAMMDSLPLLVDENPGTRDE
ncbi:MAG: SMC-Scp complex subunit ScpB, partial [Desulfuromonadales bacterium]